MNLQVLQSEKRDAWDEYVLNNPQSIAWQMYGWSDVVSLNYTTKFYPLAVMDGSEICGVLPLYHYKTKLKGDLLISVPFAVAGGIVANNDESRMILLNEAIKISEEYNKCRIALKQYKHKMPGELKTDDNFYNRELDLSKDREILKNKFDEINKKKLEDTEKYKFSLDYPSSDLNTFYKILSIHHHRRGIPCVAKKWIKTLVDFKLYSMAIIKYEGSPVAATMAKEFKDTVSFPFTCLTKDDEFTRLSVYKLYWELIQHFADKGKNIFHSGRIPNTDIADEYRLGWGGTKYTYYNQYHPKTVSQTEFTQKRSKKREMFEKIWVATPRFITNVIGPKIVKQFP